MRWRRSCTNERTCVRLRGENDHVLLLGKELLLREIGLQKEIAQIAGLREGVELVELILLLGLFDVCRIELEMGQNEER